MDVSEYTSKTSAMVTQECKEDIEATGTSPTQEKALPPKESSGLEVCLCHCQFVSLSG
jgi:hypothetical protein